MLVKPEPQFKTPFVKTDYGSSDFRPIPVNQLQQATLTQGIVSKPKWYEKMIDEKIVEKWKRESKSHYFNDSMIKFAFDQLDYYVNVFSKKYDTIYVSPVYAVYQTDGLIPDKLTDEFKKNVKKLENVPEDQLDWHPGSEKQVLDLVHPSLYPLVYRKSLGTNEFIDQTKTPMYQWIGKGEKITNFITSDSTSGEYLSEEFQWLPSNFDVSIDGKVKIVSYINNLHPYTHRDMYGNLSSIFEKFIPLFENVLTDSVNENQNIQDVDMYNLYDKPSSDAEDEEWDEWYETRHPKDIPFDKVFKPNTIKDEINLKGRKLQVIVKLANILLTPENPKYKGGVWHVEGMENEDIVATGIYYYDNENISNSELHFRQSINEPYYEQGDDKGVELIYDLYNESPLVQEIGHVGSITGRCIAFPNIYQHRVSPFELEDATKKGHRKILVFFLVNPNNTIISTANVPPQQKDWLKKYFIDLRCFGNVPNEICELIADFIEFPIDLEETKKDRIKLMDERKYISSKVDEEHYLREFSLCEH
eukprot:gene2142-2008_t